MCRLCFVHREKQFIQMKIFVVLCAILPLFQEAAPLELEDLHKYLTQSSEIRTVVHNVSKIIFDLQNETEEYSIDYWGNISAIARQYGGETSRLFRLKYKYERETFADPKYDRKCLEFVRDLYANDTRLQDQLKKYIADAVRFWIEDLKNFYRKSIEARETLVELEFKTVQCGILQKYNATSVQCVNGVVEKAQAFEKKIIDDYYHEMIKLDDNRNSGVITVLNSLNDTMIPSFYDEARIDEWLASNCPREA